MNPNAFDLMLSHFSNSRKQKPLKPEVARQGRARCPVHQNNRSQGRTLSFGVGVDGTPLINCFGPDCHPNEILSAVGLNWTMLCNNNGNPEHALRHQPITGWVGVLAGLDELNDAGYELTFTNPYNQDELFELPPIFRLPRAEVHATSFSFC